MQWRWPGKGRWKQAASLAEIRTFALKGGPSAPALVEIRDGPFDREAWMIAVPEDLGLLEPAAWRRGTGERLLRSRREA